MLTGFRKNRLHASLRSGLRFKMNEIHSIVAHDANFPRREATRDGRPGLNWLILWLALLGSCSAWCSPSRVEVRSSSAGCLDFRTASAEFEILPSGYVRALLRRSDRGLTLDEPDPRGGVTVLVDGRTIQDFRLDCVHAETGDATGRLGAAGK